MRLTMLCKILRAGPPYESRTQINDVTAMPIAATAMTAVASHPIACLAPVTTNFRMIFAFEVISIIIAMIESPLGPLLAGANDEGICLLEYTDRRMLETNLATMNKRFGCAVVPGEHKWLTQLRRELAEYFERKRRE